MIKITGVVLVMFLSSSAFAEYVNYSDVGTVAFRTDGVVQFTVSQDGQSIKCKNTESWHSLKRCPTDNLACENGVKRVAALLLSAKLANKEVSFDREGCEVTIVNLRD